METMLRVLVDEVRAMPADPVPSDWKELARWKELAQRLADAVVQVEAVGPAMLAELDVLGEDAHRHARRLEALHLAARNDGQARADLLYEHAPGQGWEGALAAEMEAVDAIAGRLFTYYAPLISTAGDTKHRYDAARAVLSALRDMAAKRPPVFTERAIVRRIVDGLSDEACAKIACWGHAKCGHPRSEHVPAILALFDAALGKEADEVPVTVDEDGRVEALPVLAETQRTCAEILRLLKPLEVEGFEGATRTFLLERLGQIGRLVKHLNGLVTR